MSFTRIHVGRLPQSPPSDVKPPKVLYVEDEDINWEIAERNLSRHYKLARACDAREAFERLSTGAYDVILMDIQLGGSDFDGLDVAKILKGHYRGAVPGYAKGVSAVDTPIVFVTAHTGRYTKSDVLEAGGEALIPKPVNFTLLAIVMASLFAARDTGSGVPGRRGASSF